MERDEQRAMAARLAKARMIALANLKAADNMNATGLDEDDIDMPEVENNEEK